MLIISASRRLAVETDEGDVLGMRSVEFSIDCRLIRDGRLGVPGYAGPYRIHERCGREPMLLVGIELRDPESSHLVSVLARVASTADIAALEHLLETFEIEAQGLPI